MPPPTTADLHTSEATHFEGSEKRLELVFVDSQFSLRRIILDNEWRYLLDIASCSILSRTSNDVCDSYILSESSLFVFRDRIIIKTCGTTALLMMVVPLLRILKAKVEMELGGLMYSRMEFLFPDEQPYPHDTFESEANFIVEALDLKKKDITQGTFGDGKWNYVLYQAAGAELESNCDEKAVGFHCIPKRFEFALYELDQLKMGNYYYHKTGTEASKVAPQVWKDIVSGQGGKDAFAPQEDVFHIDEHMFYPCGYSMNGLHGIGYSTMHITPEDGFSYVSFESNVIHPSYSFKDVIESVLKAFNPGICHILSSDFTGNTWDFDHSSLSDGLVTSAYKAEKVGRGLGLSYLMLTREK